MGTKESHHLTYYSEVAASEVAWLWYPYIALGKITLIQGDPGDGKTTLALHLASILSRGAEMPMHGSALPAGNAIYQSAEDNPSDTIKPRLMREGADCARIAFLRTSDQPLTLMSDEWERAIRSSHARLLVIDPLQAYLGSDGHMGQAADMRKMMRHLARVAEETQCAVVIIGHMNKGSGGKGVYRGLGSIDIVAAARSVLLVGRAPEDRGIRLVAQIKNSLAPEGETLAFELPDGQGIRWIGPYDLSVEEILNGSFGGCDTKIERAAERLRQLLSGGRLPCGAVYDALEREGVGKRTVDAAKKVLNVLSVKTADGWYWEMPFEAGERP